MLDVYTLTDKMESLYNRGDYAEAKNLGEWYFGEYPDMFNFQSAPIPLLIIADSLRNLSNPQRAAKVTTRFDLGDPSRPMLVKLSSMIYRLYPMFPLISGEVSLALVANENEYHMTYGKAFPGAPVVQEYPAFQSCGCSIPNLHLLIFKENMMNCNMEIKLQHCTDLAIFGMCAHELAHFDVPGGTYQNNTNPNEREADAHVLSKGLAYSLYVSRKTLGSGIGVMSADEIKSYIADIENNL